jgi:ribosomal protein S18 acetylase RimI-like enzyme
MSTLVHASPFLAEQVLAFERAAARAWPATRVIDVGGWSVRLSGGGTRRANSVLPLAWTGGSFEAAMGAVEAAYRAQGTRAYVQVSTASQPTDLDARLAARGYASEEPCLLMVKPLNAAPMPADVTVTVDPSDDWLSIYTEPLDDARRSAAPTLLATVPAPRAFLLARRGGVPLSSALAVVSPDGHVVVECVATRAATRRAGGGTLIMNALEAWACSAGARTAVLQVVAANTAAVSLYRRRGYREAGRYHYRWRDA